MAMLIAGQFWPAQKYVTEVEANVSELRRVLGDKSREFEPALSSYIRDAKEALAASGRRLATLMEATSAVCNEHEFDVEKFLAQFMPDVYVVAAQEAWKDYPSDSEEVRRHIERLRARWAETHRSARSAETGASTRTPPRAGAVATGPPARRPLHFHPGWLGDRPARVSAVGRAEESMGVTPPQACLTRVAPDGRARGRSSDRDRQRADCGCQHTSVRLFGYPEKSRRQSPLTLREVTIAADPDTLRDLAEFVRRCADLIEEHGGDFGHEHFNDWRSTTDAAGDIIVYWT